MYLKISSAKHRSFCLGLNMWTSASWLLITCWFQEPEHQQSCINLVRMEYCITCSKELTHCGLVKPYGTTDLGQHCFRWWLVAWGHQAIIWTNVDFSLAKSCGIHMRAISQWVTKLLICIMSCWNYTLKITATSPRDQWVNLLQLSSAILQPS